MSRFGFRILANPKPFCDLDCMGSAHIGSEACVFYTDKATRSFVYMYNISKRIWYKLRYDPFIKEEGE